MLLKTAKNKNHVCSKGFFSEEKNNIKQWYMETKYIQQYIQVWTGGCLIQRDSIAERSYMSYILYYCFALSSHVFLYLTN